MKSLTSLQNVCAVITPFDETGENIDYQSYENHIHYLKSTGVEAVVSLGTTGECYNVSFEEHAKMFREVVRFSPLPVIAGAGANSTAEAIHLTKEAEKACVIAILSVCPYYCRPPQSGLVKHFVDICNSTYLPILLYNVEARTSAYIEVETTLRIRDACKNFAGIKEASNKLANVERYIHEGVPVYCGEDALNFAMLCLGAQGVISVVSNFAGNTVRSLIETVRFGQLELARKLNHKMADLSKAAFTDNSPAATKFICSKLGLCKNSLRSPMMPLEKREEEIVLKLVQKHIVFPQ